MKYGHFLLLQNIQTLAILALGLGSLVGIVPTTLAYESGSAEWKLSTGGTWNDPDSWEAATPTVPNSVDAVASLHRNLTSNGIVTVDSETVVGRLDFDNPAASYTIAGPNAITLRTSSGIPVINVVTGTHTISTQVNLTANTDVSVAANSTMTISGNLTGIGAGLNKNGAGTLTLGGNNSYDGITTITSGTLIAGSSTALGSILSGTTIQNSATLDINSQILGVETITINGNGVLGNGAIVNNGLNDQLNAIQTVVLGSDASIGGMKRWDIHAPNNSSTSLDLADHTLTKVGTNQVMLVNTTVTDGNIIVNAGTFGLQKGTKVNGTGTSITVNTGGTLDVGASGTPITVSRPIVMNGGTLINNNGGTTYVESNITMNPSSTNTISTLNRLYLQGNISGSGNVNKIAGGFPLYLTGNNSGFTGTWNQNYWMTYFSSNTSGSPNANFVVNSTNPDDVSAILCTTNSGLSVQLGSLSGNSGYLLNRDQTGTNGNSSFVIGAKNENALFGGVITNNMAGALGSGYPSTGTISIEKIGTGTQILTGANVYTGATTISGGKLFFNNPTALNFSTSAGSVIVNSGCTLGGDGTIYRDVTVNSGGSIEAGGSNGTGTFTINSLTLGHQSTDNTTINMANVDTNNPSRAILNVTTDISANAKTTINVGGVLPSVGQHNILGYSVLDLVGKTFNNTFVLGTLPGRMTANLVNNTGSNEIDLNVESTDYPIWTGGADANWNVTVSNWKLASNGMLTTYIEGDNVVFDDRATKNFNVNLPNTISPTFITVNNSTHDYSFNGPGSIAGSGGLLKTGAGTLTINTINSFSGNVEINGGTVVVGTIAQVGSNSALGKGITISFDGGSLKYTGDTTISSRSVVLNTGGGTLDVSNANTTLTLLNASGAGSLTKEGDGILKFSADNIFSGNTTINQGTLELSGGLYNRGTIANSITVNNGGRLLLSQKDILGNYMADPTATIMINQGGLVENGGSGSNTYYNTLKDLTLNGGELRVNGGLTTNWQAYQLKGTVSVTGTAPSQITIGPNLYNFLIQIQIGNNSSGDLTTFDVGDVTGDDMPDLIIAPELGDGRDSSGSSVPSKLIKTGAGKMLLTGRNTYSGGTTIYAGSIQVGNGGQSGTIGLGGSVTVNADTNLVFNRNSTTVVNGTLGGAGTITQNGTGSIVLTQDNSNFTGTLNLNGPVTIANDYALGEGTNVRVNNTTIKFGAVGLNEGMLTGWDTINPPIVMTPTVNFYKYLSGNQIGLNQTVVYQGKIYLTTGQWSFAKQYDMYGYIKINDQIILNNTENAPASGSITIAQNGWYAIDLRVGKSGSLGDPTQYWPFGIGIKQGSALFPLSPMDFQAFDEGAAGISLQYTDNYSYYVANNIVLTGQNTIDTNGLGTGTVLLYGDISGAGGLTKTSFSDLFLEGNLSYTGDTYVQAGTLNVGSLTTSANITIGSNASMSANQVVTKTLTIGAGGMLVIKPFSVSLLANSEYPTTVPEPGTWILLMVAVFGFIATARFDFNLP